MASFLDVCKFRAVSSGTGNFVVSAAVQGYQTPASAGATNGAVYRYRAENFDLSEWEVGYGAYNAGTQTLARASVLFNHLGTTASVDFTSRPYVGIVALAEDLAELSSIVSTSRGGFGEDISAEDGVPVFVAGVPTFVDTMGTGDVLRESVLDDLVPLQFTTRDDAEAATIPVSYTAIRIIRYATGYPAAPAVYIPGSVSGPMAFQEAGGNYWELDLSGGLVDARWYGAKLDGVNDDTSAAQAALTASLGGKQLYIGPGTLGVSSTLDGGAGNVRVYGAGKNRSIISVLGSNTVDPVLRFTDASNVVVEDLDFRGNGVTVVIGAIQFLVTAGSNVIGNYVIQRNAFSNFKAQYWIRFLTNVLSTSHTRVMRYIRVLNNDWVASTSLAPDFTNVGIPAMMLAFQGSVDNSGSYIDDVIVSGNFVDASGVKGFANCWAGSRNIIIDQNVILNAGSLGQNDRGCYAVIAYNNHGTADAAYSPQDISVTNNTIISPRTCGFYGATVVRPYVCNNVISGAVDSTAGSLPYAAVSINQCDDARVNWNELNGNYKAVYLIPGASSPTCEAVGNKIRSTITSAEGIRVTLAGSFTSKVKVSNNQIIVTDSASLGISCYSVGAGFEYDKLDIALNRVSAGNVGITCSDSSGGGIRGNVVTLTENHIEGALADRALEIASAVAKVVIQGGTINLANAGASALGINANSASSIHIDGLQIMNRATGTALAYSATSANGSMKNVNLIGIARANLPADGSTHMGFALPTVAGTGIGQFIQNLATTSYTPAGTGGSQYTIDGWIFATGTTWYPRRCLSGT